MICRSENGLSEQALRSALADASRDLPDGARVLLLPPDYTRLYSGAGAITRILYELLSPRCSVDVMPALGTHEPMTEQECRAFFGPDVPYEKLLVHRWREDVVKLGEVPASFVREVSEGLVDQPVDVEVNRRLTEGYDRIYSIGQVVPHEVVGMANYSKNIFVGCGGASMINASHMLGAFYGMERIMGRDFSPVRRVFDYAEENFLKDIPICYILTVTTSSDDQTHIHDLYIGRRRELFEDAVAESQKRNLIHTDRPFRKAVVYLDPREFKSTWLGNKAVYRTRMAMADGGELLILAPGVRKFGEDDRNDALIRRYGYVGRENVLRLVAEHPDLAGNLSVAAHLIHGSSDGRFRITYATRSLSEAEVRGAGFGWMSYDEAARLYDPAKLTDGWHTLPDGEEIFYVSNPALGLWIYEGDKNA